MNSRNKFRNERISELYRNSTVCGKGVQLKLWHMICLAVSQLLG